MPNLPLCNWSSQLFDLRAPSSTDVPVLLLNQPSPWDMSCVASRVEVCVIGESDFVNNENDFILKDNPGNPDWEIDSTISLE